MKLTKDAVLKNFPLAKPRDMQVDAIEKAVAAYVNGAEYVVLEAPVGCHQKGTLILLATGEIKVVEDIEVGDLVMGSDGLPQRVTELKRGRSKMVRIIPHKGDSFTVNVDHILTLVETETGKVVDVCVREFLEWSAWKASQHKLFRAPVLQFLNGSEPQPINSYVLGLLLGDGALTKGVQVCKADEELSEPLRIEATKFGLQYRFSGGVHRIVDPMHKPNAMMAFLRQWGLDVTSEQRFIPPQFKVASFEDRLQMLAGLLDTDGHMSNGGFDYISKSLQLAEDVTFIARSLGFAAYLKACEKFDQNGHGGTYFRVSISGDCNRIPTRIARKRAPVRQQKKDVLRTGFTWELLPEDDFYGFSLDGDGRFLMGDFTVTHNTGKSAIAVAFARTFGKSFMLTLTEQLQEQYVRDFSQHGLMTLKGRGKFKCHSLGATATCADGRHNKPPCKACPYQLAKKSALESSHVVANYHSYLWNIGMGGVPEEGGEDEGVGGRPFLVVDEAHAMEGFLLDAIGVTVRLNKLSVQVAMPPDDETASQPYFDYISEELLPKLKAELKRTVDPKAREECLSLIGKLSMVMNTSEEVRWIPERGTVMGSNTLDRTWFALKPLYVSRWGHQLYKHGQKQLFMSGTILSAAQFVQSIGHDPNVGDHIELDSPFPVENRPIFVGNLDMSYKARDSSWPIMVKMVDQLMSAHPNEKGLLLCPSNAMLQHIQKGLGRVNSARLIFAAGENRMEQYNRHINGRGPTVLAASGFWEGADLKGDASRFQIIPQAPRPMWKGQIAARAQAPGGDAWYRWQTWQKFLQGTGRSVRSETDTAATYVFDKELRTELKRSGSMIPKWVRVACKEVG